MVEGIRPRRKRVSFFSSFVSITLVLFLIGVFVLLVYHANGLKNYLKENVQMSLLFMEDANEPDILHFEQQLENMPQVKRVKYISKKEARKIMAADLGEDAIDILGYNPFPPSLDIYFEASYAAPDSLEKFKKGLLEKRNNVREVFYQKALVKNIDKNIRIAGALVLFFAILFMFIALVLINNTIRLTLYSKRFLIKSMQLVGATRWFIRRPFILKSVFHGLLGGICASGLLWGVIYLLKQKFPLLKVGYSPEFLVMLFPGLMFLGIIITGISSFFSMNKYLKMKLEDLY